MDREKEAEPEIKGTVELKVDSTPKRPESQEVDGESFPSEKLEPVPICLKDEALTWFQWDNNPS
ncbi:hypothetical protein K8353_47300, partial [Burkholderia contaminans]|nr:hypothetical protein [Burkholderia contaminans]